MPSADQLHNDLFVFVDEHCICRNCIFVTARPEPGIVVCDHPEDALIDGIPHADWQTCECQELNDLVLQAVHDDLSKKYYTQADREGLFDPPY